MRIKSFFDKKRRFSEISKKIKKVEIQGARNIARNALYAYSLIPTKSSKRKLLSLRPTEPMLINVLDKMGNQNYSEIIKHFDKAQNNINSTVLKLIKKNDLIFTHCHSTNVVKSLIFAKENKKNFEIYVTETRPLFQGRKTAKELKDAKIKVTMFVDSAIRIALLKKQKTKRVKKIFLGADALLKKGVINKVGSGLIAEIASQNKIPVYIIADSWKYYPKKIELEERDFHEVWKKLSKKSKIKVRNPSFEFIPKKYITGIVSELGILKYDEFLGKIKN